MKNKQPLVIFSVLASITSLALAQPDLICSDINNATSFGVVGGTAAYSFGTVLCNVGNAPAQWEANTNKHPLISQTLYQLSDGQIRQIGIGFVRHTTIPLDGNLCGLNCTPAGPTQLGAGCSDTSASTINGVQSLLGPRSEVNAFTGFFPYPFTSINQTGNTIYKRLQVSLADVSDPNALYFIETQVITSSETTPQARANNASYRRVTFTPGSATALLMGPTYTEQAAIFAWRDHGLGIGMPDSSVLIDTVVVPGDGIIHVASKATDLGNDSWRYDYALHNQNMTQSLRSLEVFTGIAANPASVGMQGVEYVDAPDSDIEDESWEFHDGCSDVRWITKAADENIYANAVRWGTTYSFSFELDIPPAAPKNIRIGLFDPLSASFTQGIAHTPSGTLPCSIADLNCDGIENFFDVSAFISAFNAQDPAVDFTNDGLFNFFDVSMFLGAFGAGCP